MPNRSSRIQVHSLLLLLGAAAACGGGNSAPDAAEAEADAAPAVPLISDALADTCGDYTPGSGVAPGDDLHRVVFDDPDAVCNDGTPAVMFVRPSTGGANATRWVFYLQGGGGCGQFQDCGIRYCGSQKYTKAKMSSRWTPMVANTDDQGLLDRDGVNPYADANLVLMYYCSSDSWMGRKNDTVLTNPDDTTQQYRLHFRGRTIIETALDQLLAGELMSEDGMVTMPSLADATAVLWSGTSAGANGAEQSIDYVTERLSANGTVVRGLFDANLPPLLEDLGDATAQAAFEAYDRDVQWPQIYVDGYDAAVDESCLAAHSADEQWLCGENEHVVLNHITTPFFVRQDLRDRTIGRRYVDNGATDAQLATAYRTTLLRVPDITTNAEEAAAIDFTPGLYVPNCGQHVGVSNDPWFNLGTVETPGGTPLTYRAALGAWLMDTEVYAVDTQPSTLAVCPSPLDSGE